MPESPDSLRPRSRFSWLPLLMAVAVIACLLVLLFPFVIGNRDGGNRRTQQALQDTRAIVHAVEQYKIEYGAYPRVLGTDGSSERNVADEAVGDPDAGMKANNANLFDVLRDLDRGTNAAHKQNVRRVEFIDAKSVSDPAHPRSGFLEVPSPGNSEGSFYDLWGKQYNVVIDSNGDGRIDVGAFYEDFRGENAPPVSVGAFSTGKDKMLGKKGDRKYRSAGESSDDCVSWLSR